MTTTNIRPADLTGTGTSTEGDRAIARRATVPVLAAAVVIAATLSIIDANSVPERFVDVGLELVAGIVLAFLVIPRALRQESAGGRALAFGIVAVLLVFPAFWSGLPLIFGAAAALLGWAGRRATRRAALSVAGFALGLLGVIGYAAMYVIDTVTH